MAFEMESSPEKIHLIILKKTRGDWPQSPPPLIFTFQELTIARLRKPDKCPVSFRIEPLRLFSHVSLFKRQKTKLIRIYNRSHPPPPPPPASRKNPSGRVKDRNRKSSPQTRLLMLNMQVHNQSHLNTKWKHYSVVSEREIMYTIQERYFVFSVFRWTAKLAVIFSQKCYLVHSGLLVFLSV